MMFSNTTVSNTSRCLGKTLVETNRPERDQASALFTQKNFSWDQSSLHRKTLAETKVFKTAKQVQYLQYYSLVYRDFRWVSKHLKVYNTTILLNTTVLLQYCRKTLFLNTPLFVPKHPLSCLLIISSVVF
jgi:hypothetical protein